VFDFRSAIYALAAGRAVPLHYGWRMSSPTFRDFDPGRDRKPLIALMTSEEWTYRTRPRVSEAEVLDELERGEYAGEDALTIMIEVDGEVAGYARADGLAHEWREPQLDFRLRERMRGRGIGLAALRHITDAIFSRYPAKHRIEGQTRQDNVAMRTVFVRGGYVQEAVYRRAWPAADGEMLDGIGYAMLRADWESGTTTPLRWD
jgi:RimJ/RimL family protein N-acetyltransferase